MASPPYDPRPIHDGAGPSGAPATPGHEVPLGELLRRLTTDTGELVRQEMLLARTEIRETGTTLARDGARIGVAAGLALAGVLALTAFAVLALGTVLDNYWLAALIVGLALLGGGALLGRNAVADIKRRGLVPTETLGSLRDDAAWAGQEAHAVRRELTTPLRGD